MPDFHVVSPYEPAGDQRSAIAALAKGVELGLGEQTLLGVTGSGKTFTMAKVIEKVQRPTLVLAHNKTLAAQLCAEFKEFFPDNAVEYFVSYYDYYQPEAYIPHTDTFIEKDSSVNDEIDRLRLSATASLIERRDVIVVSSVSCIYGLGEPDDYAKMMVPLRVGEEFPRDELLRRPGAYVLQLDYRDFYELFDLKPVVSGYLHMDGAPLGAYDPSYGKMLLQLEAMGIPFRSMGLGGHARPYYLKQMVDLIAPKVLVPLHSQRPEQVASRCAGRRILPEEGQTLILEKGEVKA